MGLLLSKAIIEHAPQIAPTNVIHVQSTLMDLSGESIPGDGKLLSKDL